MTMKTSTKMYLMVFLSTTCIFLYQYHLSKAGLITSQDTVDHIANEMVMAQTSTTIKVRAGSWSGLPLI